MRRQPAPPVPSSPRVLITDYQAHAKVLAAALQRVIDDPKGGRLYAEEALRACPAECRTHVIDLHWVAAASLDLLRTAEGSIAERSARAALEARIRQAGLVP